jgi:hypothetical protein
LSSQDHPYHAEGLVDPKVLAKTIAAQLLGNGGKIEPYTIIIMVMILHIMLRDSLTQIP